MVYNESMKNAIRKYIANNWETKYKDYYQEYNKNWKKENKQQYNDYQNKYMKKRAAYQKEVKRLLNIIPI